MYAAGVAQAIKSAGRPGWTATQKAREHTLKRGKQANYFFYVGMFSRPVGNGNGRAAEGAAPLPPLPPLALLAPPLQDAAHADQRGEAAVKARGFGGVGRSSAFVVRRCNRLLKRFDLILHMCAN